MKLVTAQTFLHWNFVDSGEVPIQESVTCLVGKNESGKTSFLRALYQLNPAYDHHLKPDITHDYPRWRAARDRRTSNLDEVIFVKGIFSLNHDDYEAINSVFTTLISVDFPKESLIVVEKDYGGNQLVSVSVSEDKVIASVLERFSLSNDIKRELIESGGFEGAKQILDERKKTESDNKSLVKDLKAISDLLDKVDAILDLENEELETAITSRLPKFFYFSNYSILRGRIDLNDLLAKDPRKMKDDERTALSLIRLANATGKEFQADDFEFRVSELEAAANLITQEIFNYWTTNEDLVVRLVHDSQVVEENNAQKVVHRYVDLRLNDLRHQVTTNFERRSSGFQWFFSFITAFTEFENSKEKVVVLLDEPGLNLHARAQYDFIRFINERLAKKCQVIYTTHSPFMVEASSLDRVRLVEDLTTKENPDIGAKISMDITSVNGDTLFPLQAALGYDLAQNLFIGRHNLIVEGPSDYIYLITISEY